MTESPVVHNISASTQLKGVPSTHVKKSRIFKRALAKVLRFAGNLHRQEFKKSGFPDEESQVWPFQHWQSHALGLWFVHGCSGDRMLLLKHEGHYGLGSSMEKHDAWYTQHFEPSKHFGCVVRATQATSGEVGQVCMFCAFTLQRDQ